MVLEQVRNCRIRREGENVVVIGICKVCLKEYRVFMSVEVFEKWKGGIPLSYLAPFSDKEINFLTTGIWRTKYGDF